MGHPELALALERFEASPRPPPRPTGVFMATVGREMFVLGCGEKSTGKAFLHKELATTLLNVARFPSLNAAIKGFKSQQVCFPDYCDDAYAVKNIIHTC